MPYFEPPIAYDLPPTLPGARGVINSHARWKKGQRRGRSVLKTAGVYKTVDSPTVDETKAADIYYAGGHIYEVSDAERLALEAAEYTVTLGIPGDLLTESGDYITDELGVPLRTEYV